MNKIFKNFKTVTYCVAQWADKVSEEQLRKEVEFFQKYVGDHKERGHGCGGSNREFPVPGMDRNYHHGTDCLDSNQ